MDNPFRIGERVSGEYFTDRAEEVKRIHRAMRDPSRLLVYGPRRMGKSSAIQVAADRFSQEGGIAVRADLGGATGTTEVADRLLTSLARAVPSGNPVRLSDWIQALRLELTADPAGAPVLRLGVRPPDGLGARRVGEGSLGGLAAVLDRLDRMGAEGEAPVCVVLDEFQRLVEFGTDRAGWELRDLMQGHHHLSYVCAGSEEGIIEDLTAGDGPFHGAFERLYVAEMPRDHFARWIGDRMRSGGLKVADGVGADVIDRAGPRTEDVLKLARQVWFQSMARGRLEPGDVDDALSAIVRADRGVFETLWAGLTPHQRNVLRAVAGGAEALTSADVREHYNLRSASAVSQAVDAHLKRGLLARARGVVVFEDPFFGAWVRKELPPGV
jgi:uncharacterized protein